MVAGSPLTTLLQGIRRRTLVVVGLGCASPVCFGGETANFITGFETDEVPAYQAGTIDGQGTGGSWTLKSGTATVRADAAAGGTQGVGFESYSEASVAVSAANPVIWTDLKLEAAGATTPPVIPNQFASAVLFLSANNGVMALDGNGSGGGSFISLQSPLPPAGFVRVSLRQDFVAKTYDVWIDGSRIASGLGFKDDHLGQIHSVDVCVETAASLDDLSVTGEGLDSDADADALADLDEVKFLGTDPLNPDSDRDGSSDGDEVVAGTDPNDSASLFRARLEPEAEGNQTHDTIEYPTVAGRLYTVQYSDHLDGWKSVPGLVDIPGTGSPRTHTLARSVPARFYRVQVMQP